MCNSVTLGYTGTLLHKYSTTRRLVQFYAGNLAIFLKDPHDKPDKPYPLNIYYVAKQAIVWRFFF